MNASNTTLSSGSAVYNDVNWSISFSEIVYFGTGFVLGCIFMFFVVFLRAKCERSKKDESKDESNEEQHQESSGHML